MKQRILLTGKDGIDLLQRITTLDISRIKPGIPQPGLILNAQGKILSFFEVRMTDHPDQLELGFEDSFLDLLDQYTFSERYRIEKLPMSPVIEIQESERILKRIPKPGNEFQPNGETNPLEINLHHAIHDQKGCYPGQEVIEKIIAIGSPAKKLCLVKLKEGSPSSIVLPLDLDFGKLTSLDQHHGLAIVRKTHAAPGSILKADDIIFEVLES